MDQPQSPSPVQGQQQTAAPTQPVSVPQQPRASYAPQQQAAAPPFQQPAPYYAYGAAPRVVPFDKNWYWAKIGLTIASIIFAIITLILGVTLARGPQSDMYGSGYEYIAQQDNAHLKGIHPGAHVGVDLILWLGGLVTLLFSLSSAIGYRYRDRMCEDDYYLNSDYYHDYYEEYCRADAIAARRSYVSIGRALVAFIGLLTLTHFIIFVRACVETNQRNRMRGPIIMVPAQHMSMYMTPQQPGMMPMMPPQTYMAPAAHNEKAAAAPSPQAHVAPAEGFYAPHPPAASHAGQAV
ncbi:hypothetical protein PG985_008128 [Apiospora marii]|uniref:uncharacterized protein n=1 Tax=Apiospora marii TaxID=335849 RepID=UPI00312D484C